MNGKEIAVIFVLIIVVILIICDCFCKSNEPTNQSNQPINNNNNNSDDPYNENLWIDTSLDEIELEFGAVRSPSSITPFNESERQQLENLQQK